MRWVRWIVLPGLAVVAALGISRLRMDTDILAMLPGGLSEVRGLRVVQEEFSRAGELVILLECGEEDAGLLQEVAEELAVELESAGVAKAARWRPAWSDDPAEMAELIAYLWLNGDPAAIQELAGELSPERAGLTMEKAVARVASSLEGMDMVIRAHDPFGFLGQEEMVKLIERQGGGEGFGSADGRAFLLLIEAPEDVDVTGYKAAGAWLDEVRGVCERRLAEGNEWVSFGFTGNPAFNAEIGGAIERDMSKTIGLTSLLIGGLFLWMQRRLRLLLGMGVMLGLVFLITLGAGGWIFGSLGIMSAGFAAILIGLAVDYGVLICQEAKLEQHDVAAIRRSVLRSIAWAAATTAAVFAALNASSLPGIGQLGSLVAIGIVVGALVMLGLYVPWVAWAGAGRVTAGSGPGAPFPRRGRSVSIAVVMGAMAVGALVWKGRPGIEFDFALMRPKNSSAMETFERVQASYPAWEEGTLKLVVEGGSPEEIAKRVDGLVPRLEGMLGEGLLADWWLPVGWWPDAGRQAANRALAASLTGDAERVLGAADEAGFNEQGRALGKAVLEQLGELAASDGTVFPQSAAAADIMRGFLARTGDGGVLLGEVRPANGVLDDPRLLAIQDEGVSLAGWEALRPAVLPLVRRDLYRVFLPMALVMVVMLGAVFRRAREVALVVGAMAFSGLMLCGLMAVAGLEWNFLNVAAIPLLLGTAVDYGIHMLLALRRCGDDFARAWHGTGKAIVFCGVSTAIGFGSLSFASNEAMASMGMVCAVGILLNMGTAVLLLPGWRGGSAR
jgi:predicted RND superfamily exporter protein